MLIKMTLCTPVSFLLPYYDIGIFPMKECRLLQLALLFLTVAKSGTSVLTMLGDFSFSTTGIFKALLKSGGNIGWAMTRCAAVF